MSSQRSAQSGLPEIFVQHLEAVHELDDAARLEALPRVGVAGPAILVPGKSAAGELAVEAHDRLVIALGRAEELRLLAPA